MEGYEQASRDYERYLANGGYTHEDYENDERLKTFDDLNEDDVRTRHLQIIKEKYKNNTEYYIELLENEIVDLIEWCDYLQHSKNKFIEHMEGWRTAYYELKSNYRKE